MTVRERGGNGAAGNRERATKMLTNDYIAGVEAQARREQVQNARRGVSIRIPRR
jgi:hypothetical protein